MRYFVAASIFRHFYDLFAFLDYSLTLISLSKTKMLSFFFLTPQIKWNHFYVCDTSQCSRTYVLTVLECGEFDPTKWPMNVAMNDLYSPLYEQLWLNSAVPLILNVSKKSGDYERKLFDAPLTKKWATRASSSWRWDRRCCSAAGDEPTGDVRAIVEQ